MPIFTLAIGLALMVLGVGFFIGTGAEEKTALIPVIPGILLALCGGLAMAKPAWRKHVMHVAMLFALLTVLLIGGRLPMAMMDEDPSVPAIAEMWIALVFALVLLVMGVWSFIEARRARTSETPGA